MGLETLAIAAIATAAIGTAVSVKGSMDAASAQRKSMKSQQKLASIQSARERTQQIRASRAARAQVEQAAANTGSSESSSALTGASGASMRGFQNIGFINAQESAGVRISEAQQDYMAAQGTVALGQGITSIGGAIMNNRQEISNIFGKKTGK